VRFTRPFFTLFEEEGEKKEDTKRDGDSDARYGFANL
jgi:hypothetical protein